MCVLHESLRRDLSYRQQVDAVNELVDAVVVNLLTSAADAKNYSQIFLQAEILRSMYLTIPSFRSA